MAGLWNWCKRLLVSDLLQRVVKIPVAVARDGTQGSHFIDDIQLLSRDVLNLI